MTIDMGEDDLIAVLRQHGVHTVCDAGCGCGIYSLKLAANGFVVSGFDISARAVEIAQAFLDSSDYQADLKTGSVLATGYADNAFDCVLSRDVLDHIRKVEAELAIKELCRITKPCGIILFIVDATDEEYETQPHTVTADGDYVFNDGKWNGMVFHPYTREELSEIIPSDMEHDGDMTILLKMNSKVAIKPMTREMYHVFFREYQNDPTLYLDPADYVSYVYTEETVDRYIQRQIDRNRLPFAIMVGDEIVGELKFYDIKPGESVFMGIAMKNDTCKGKGYGTQAERIAIDYCFHTLDIPVLYADSVLTNTRSQHVLEKVGFAFLREDAQRRYYVCRRET